MTQWALDQLGNLATVDEDSLLKNMEERFAGRFGDETRIRVLIHTPPENVGIAMFSWATNLLDGLNYLGIPARPLKLDDQLDVVLAEFNPTVLMSSWHPFYRNAIDWEKIETYRADAKLRVGLTAALEESEGRRVLNDVLTWAASKPVDFFFHEDLETNGAAFEEYKERGYAVLSASYGANPIAYHPVRGIDRDIDYAFLGSAHRNKWSSYVSFFGEILRTKPGFLAGPGWGTAPSIPKQIHSLVYARARVGLNLHQRRQLLEPIELNERTYNLAAAGVPQLVDDPPLLDQKLGRDSCFVADNAKEFRELFGEILRNPEEAEKRAQLARQRVLAKDTIFHRAEELVEGLLRI